MSLDSDRLANAIVDAILASTAGSGLDLSEEDELRDQWKLIASEIISEFTDNAVVTVPGVQTGGSTVTGTIS